MGQAAVPGGALGLKGEIEKLTAENRAGRDPERERRLLQLRHEAGIALLDGGAGPEAAYPEPAPRDFGDGPIPTVTPDQLTPGLVRAAILRSGCLMVKGLVDPEAAVKYADRIQLAIEEREAPGASPAASASLFDPFEAQERFGLVGHRMSVTGWGGIWAADAPPLTFEMLEMFEDAGLTSLIRDYLGEEALFSVQKSTLRRVDGRVIDGRLGWHQDGWFLGDVRALNVWVALTRCGDDAPGLYLMPRRFEEILPTGTGGAVFHWVVSPEMVEERRGEIEIVKPDFEPGDAMLFDHLFLHSTAADSSMPNYRYAIETWFFGASAFPGEYAPLAL